MMPKEVLDRFAELEERIAELDKQLAVVTKYLAWLKAELEKEDDA